MEVGREMRVSRRLAPGLLARIHILGVGFTEEGLKWKLEGLDSRRKASSGSWRACFPEGLPETCLLTACGRERGRGPLDPTMDSLQGL